MRSVLRRAAGRAETRIRHRGITLDPITHAVERDGEPVLLSAHEFSVLEALLQRPGSVLSRAQLEDRLLRWGESVESNAVEVYVHGLRRKLRERCDPHAPRRRLFRAERAVMSIRARLLIALLALVAVDLDARRDADLSPRSGGDLRRCSIINCARWRSR